MDLQNKQNLKHKLQTKLYDVYRNYLQQNNLINIITNLLINYLYYMRNSVIDQKKLEFEPEPDFQKSSTSEKSQANDIHMTQKKRVIFWLYVVLLGLYFAGIIALTITQWGPMQQYKTSDNFYFGNQVAYQWTLGFIQDIKVTSALNCPNGYQSSFTFEWPGTGYGCQCSSGENVSFVLDGYCSATLIQKNCVNMASQAAINATMWRNNSNICIKRSQNSFANEKSYDITGTNKLCGLSESTVITPLNQPCPFVNISFSNFVLEKNTVTVSDSQHLLPPMYAIYNSTSPYSFYSYPVIKFKVSEYEFCLMDEDNGLDPDHSDFILLTEPRQCEKTGNYTTLDTLSEIDFYASNSALNDLQNKVGFPKPSNWDYSLGFANLPGWTYPCRHNYGGRFKIQNASNQFNFIFFDNYKAAVIVIAIAVAAIGTQVFVLVLRRIFNSSIYPVGYKQRYLPFDFCSSITRYVYDLCCKVIILIIAFYLTWSCYYNWNWFKGVTNFSCYANNQQIRQYIIQPYTALYLNSFQLSTAISVLTVVMLIVDLIHFIFIWKQELRHYLVQSETKIMLKNTQEDDLKWMNEKSRQNLIAQNIEDNVNDDQFKITMAQNMFHMEDQQPQRQRKVPRKKKKKKILPFRKKADLQQSNQMNNGVEGVQFPSQFNPYQLDDNALFNMDSIMSNIPKKDEQGSKRKRRK